MEHTKTTISKVLLSFFLLFATIGLQAQNNLLDLSTWTPGNGSVPGFQKNGTDAENVRESGVNPQGLSDLLWAGYPSSSGQSKAGWTTNSTISINPSQSYRFTLWIKKTVNHDGNNYFGFTAVDGSGQSSIFRPNGTAVSNAYFYIGDLPQVDQWYLIVGYVYDSSYSSSTNVGGIYDTNGTLVQNITDFKFGATTQTAQYRIFHNSNAGANNNQVYFHNPTIYILNGQEPSISDLINPGNSGDLPPTSPTSLTSTGQTHTTVDLSWSGASDDIGVTGYHIYLGNTLHTTVNDSPYQVTGLAPSTSYTITVNAIDAAGNESANNGANTISVTTDAAPGGGGGSGGSGQWTGDSTILSYDGNVAIGTTTVQSGYKLAVDGDIITRKVRVEQTSWPDYVFKKDYPLPTLEQVREHIRQKGHLPNIPSAKEAEEKGVELGEMDRLLLKKIEELTLYILLQEERLDKQQKEIDALRKL